MELVTPLTSSGRSFRVRAAETLKVRLTVDSLNGGTTRRLILAEHCNETSKLNIVNLTMNSLFSQDLMTLVR